MSENDFDVLLLTGKMVSKITGLSRSSIYNKLNEKSRYHDPLFPRPFSLGLRSNRWFRRDIDRWIEKSAAASLNRFTEAKK